METNWQMVVMTVEMERMISWENRIYIHTDKLDMNGLMF